MKRPLAVGLWVLVSMLAHPTPAAAGFWAWLEEWSGPGPFRGYTFLFTGCVQDRTWKPSPIAMNDRFHFEKDAEAADDLVVVNAARRGKEPFTKSELLRRYLANPDLKTTHALITRRMLPTGAQPVGLEEPLVTFFSGDESVKGAGHTDQRLLCAYFDQGFFSAVESRGFPEVDAHLTDIGASARLHDGVDIGGGVGFVSFSGKTFETKRQMTLTPFRIVLRPILIGIPDELRKKWMGLLSFYWKETYVIGELTGETFGVPDNNFSVNGELIRSFGLNVDITALFPAKWGLH